MVTGASGDDYSVKSITWLPDSRKPAVSKLQVHLPTLFHTLSLQDQGTWSEFNKTSECEKTFPQQIDSKLTSFQKVIVIQTLRPDRLYSAMTAFAQKALALPSLNPPPLDLHEIWGSESSAKEPLMILTGVGADPTQELAELGSKVMGKEKYHIVAMGQGQQQNAITLLRKCCESGEWLILSNLHLVVSFIPEIQKTLATIKPHEHFRLWLTTESDPQFPVVFLQESLKLTYEAPPGIKNNLVRTYTQWKETSTSGAPEGSGPLLQQTYFVLSWLHAILQERRSFIPEAWLKFYEFSNSDIRSAKTMIEIQLTKSSTTPDWESIRGLIENAIYGGRIENVLDIGVLQAYLSKFFNSKTINGTVGNELAPTIPLPTPGSYIDALSHIHQSIPSTDQPKFFGLPENILFSWEISQSSKTIAQIRNLLVDSGTSKGFSKNAWNAVLNPILGLWKRLNQGSTLHSMDLPSPVPSDDPIAEVLSLEYVHAVSLVSNSMVTSESAI